MALWFAELGLRKMIETSKASSHANNKWLTRGQAAKRRIVNIDDMIAAQSDGTAYL